jgi:hypothetical protein
VWSPSAALMLVQTPVTSTSFVDGSPRRVECRSASLQPLRHLQSSVPVWPYVTPPRRVLRPAQRRNIAGRVLPARGAVGGALVQTQRNFLPEIGVNGPAARQALPLFGLLISEPAFPSSFHCVGFVAQPDVRLCRVALVAVVLTTLIQGPTTIGLASKLRLLGQHEKS